MSDPRIDQIFNRLESLMDRAEKFLPNQPKTDWEALAFRWRTPGYLQAIEYLQELYLEDLLHIDRQKVALTTNTNNFLAGLPANHALLWGARGTGKSSLIKALLNEYAKNKLRLIEVDKDGLINLTDVIAPLYDRPERFILFCDDLSFEANEPNYKSLKAALDGSIEHIPENTLIYATSNRRHLLPESMQDNQDSTLVEGELHHGDAIEEKISLSDRFGLWLSFHPMTQNQYLDIVNYWIECLGLPAKDEDKLRREALKFVLHRGSQSGRVARQFANHWASLNPPRKWKWMRRHNLKWR